MSAFYEMFYPSTNRSPSLRGNEKPPWSLGLNLYLKFTVRLRDLTGNCMCGLQRLGSYSKIMLNTITADRVNPCNLLCVLLSNFLRLKWFRLGITKGLNTY